MTQVFLTTGSTNPWATPGDWTNTGNSVELVGRGGTGGTGTQGASSVFAGTGGGGGAYRNRVDLTLSGNIPWRVGTNASAVTTRFGNDGSTGTNYFGAQFGANGAGSGASGGAGGVSTEETGGTPPGSSPTGFAGGAGGGSSAKTIGGGGGGGSAGPSGAGKDGGTGVAAVAEGGSGGGGSNGGSSSAGTSNNAANTDGGEGGNGTSGAGGGTHAANNATVGGGGGGGNGSAVLANPGSGGQGASDTAYDSSHGSGGGGGAGGIQTSTGSGLSVSGGNGGSYGGGGGASGGLRATGTITPGTGADGLIVITYTPGAAFVYSDFQQGGSDPKHPRFQSRGAGHVGGHVGIERPFTVWNNAGWEVQCVQPPKPRPERSAAIAPKDDGTQAEYIFVTPPIAGWEIQSWQPPHRAQERKASAFLEGDDGIEGQFQIWQNGGWEIQSPQPPTTKQKRFGSFDTTFDIDARFIDWKNYGFNAWPTQPVHPRRERVGALLEGIDGIDGLYNLWFNVGWEIQSVQPPKPKRLFKTEPADGDWSFAAPVLATADYPWQESPWVYPRKSFTAWAATAPRQEGIEKPFQLWLNAGWEVQPPQPPKPKPERGAQFARGHDGIEFPYISPAFTVDFDWEQTPSWIYTRKNFAKWAAITPREDGTERPFQFWQNAGWEIQSVQPPRRRHEKWPLADWDDGNYDRLNVFYNFGWPIQLPQPPHPRPERTGSIARGDDGIESIKPFGLQTGDFAWAQTPWVYPRIRFERAGAVMPKEDGIERPFSLWFNYGWDIQPPPPPKPKRLFKTEPTDGYWSFVPTVLATADYAWHETPWVYPRKNFNRAAALRAKLNFAAYFHFKPWYETPWVYPRKNFAKWASIAPRDDGIQSPFSVVRRFGWEIQPFQPPRRRHERWPLADWDDGNYSIFAVWRNFGWEVQSPQPPHPRREKIGSIVRGDDGTQAERPVGLQTGAYPWHDEPWTYPRKQWERWASIVPREDGIERTFSRWFNFGWEIQPVQPPHQWIEKRGAIMPREDGIENIKPFGLQTGDYPWHDEPWTYPRKQWERWAALVRGQDGIPITALLTAAYPWHDEPFVYPRRKPERWGAIARGDDGNQGTYNFFRNLGWPVQPWQPPRRRHELRGAIAPRDDGTQYPLLRFFNFGWPIQPWQPPHPKYLHQYIQDIGSYPLNLFQFVPPPPLVPPRRRSKRLVSLFFQDERNVEVSDVRTNLQNPNIRRREDTDPSR